MSAGLSDISLPVGVAVAGTNTDEVASSTVCRIEVLIFTVEGSLAS